MKQQMIEDLIDDLDQHNKQSISIRKVYKVQDFILNSTKSFAYQVDRQLAIDTNIGHNHFSYSFVDSYEYQVKEANHDGVVFAAFECIFENQNEIASNEKTQSQE